MNTEQVACRLMMNAVEAGSLGACFVFVQMENGRFETAEHYKH